MPNQLYGLSRFVPLGGVAAGASRNFTNQGMTVAAFTSSSGWTLVNCNVSAAPAEPQLGNATGIRIVGTASNTTVRVVIPISVANGLVGTGPFTLYMRANNTSNLNNPQLLFSTNGGAALTGGFQDTTGTGLRLGLQRILFQRGNMAEFGTIGSGWSSPTHIRLSFPATTGLTCDVTIYLLRAGEMSEPSALITCDDGIDNFRTSGVPELVSRNLPVSMGLWTTKNLEKAGGTPDPGFISEENLISLLETVGANGQPIIEYCNHSDTHLIDPATGNAYLSSGSPSEINNLPMSYWRDDWLNSRAKLQRLKGKVRSPQRIRDEYGFAPFGAGTVSSASSPGIANVNAEEGWRQAGMKSMRGIQLLPASADNYSPYSQASIPVYLSDDPDVAINTGLTYVRNGFTPIYVFHMVNGQGGDAASTINYTLANWQRFCTRAAFHHSTGEMNFMFYSKFMDRVIEDTRRTS